MISDFKELLERYSVSDETGMAIYRGFDPSALLPYSQRCRQERITYQSAMDAAKENGVEVILGGTGLIGAVAAIPYYSRADESIVPEV